MPVLRWFIGDMGFYGNQQHFLGLTAQYAGLHPSPRQDLEVFQGHRHILLLCLGTHIQYVDTQVAISAVPLNPNNFWDFSGVSGEIAKFPHKNAPKTPNTRPFKPGDSHQIPEFP
jgi:hypothetical protein